MRPLFAMLQQDMPTTDFKIIGLLCVGAIVVVVVGGGIAAVVTMLSRGSSRVDKNMTPCPGCGRLNPPGDNFCPQCGRQLNSSPSA